MGMMKFFCLIPISLVYLMLLSSASFAIGKDMFKYPFYFGLTSGYGSTTWQALVPSRKHQNVAISISTPKYVTEGGIIAGVFAGYEILPTFAVEVAYQRYPNAKIEFDPLSIFAFENNNVTQFTTYTDLFSLIFKAMFIIPCTSFRAFSSAGAAEVHRSDQINDHWRLSPTFALGVNDNLNEHIMAELGINYTAGYGETELSPTNDYFPFLYSLYLRLAYRF